MTTGTRLFARAIVFALVAVCQFAFADSKRFVALPDGQKLYVEVASGDVLRPTVVLLNGLTYSVRSWDPFVKELRKFKFNIIRYDMRGHGKTLEKDGPMRDAVDLQTQVEDLSQLLDELKVESSVTLVGLSYGGGVATEFALKHPERAKQVVLMAPYVRALASQDSFIRSQIAWTRLMFPFNPASDEQLYDYFLSNIVFSTYPIAEPTVLDQPGLLNAVYQLTRGIRHYDFIDEAPALAIKTHLIVAGRDQYVPRSEHDGLWEAIPIDMRASRIVINGSEHKIPEAVPSFAAAWLNLILNDDTRLAKGTSFEGDTIRFEVTAGRTKIKLK